MKTAGLSFSLLLFLVGMAAGEPVAGVMPFDTNPGWESFRSRLMPDPLPVVKQHFGYRGTHFAGGGKAGEIGGRVQRSMNPATYAKMIPARSLEDKLTASGTFAVTKNHGPSGALFGWFNEKSRGWRTPNSLVFRIDGNNDNYWILFEYGTRHWLTGGGATFEGRYQTTKTKPFAADGTPHRWSLTYDPAAEAGSGAIVFTLDGKEWRQPLAPEHKADGAVFDRFGLFNQQTTGDGLEVYFDDVMLDGQAMDFSEDPQWEARGNDGTFAERAIRPLHNFGFSNTSFAGGGKGEIGGIIWRDEKPAYYAAKTIPLTLQDELTASGRLAFTAAGSDSSVYLGWFDSQAKQNKTTPEHLEDQKNILAINIEGPSRVGHYFRPAYRNAAGEGEIKSSGPLILPDGRTHRWKMHYSPAGAGGKGQITVIFDDSTQTLDLKPGLKESSARFDRFGLFNTQTGGWHTELYIDDLTLTGAPPK
ncbi:MAG TPA: hypothetical protein VG796_09785 [Verrucomicrobiales bacterium]|jgi:hypothetical protein|nr:hypothetical protein [Verrucomicrobiales bacterium]